MRLGLHLVNFDFPGRVATELAAIGAAVEEAGFDNLSVMDHVVQLGVVGPPESRVLEGYTALGFLAAHTRTVALQVLVSSVTYRNPGMLAHAVATLDELSSGRAVLGLGAGWSADDHRALGLRLPSAAERLTLLEDAINVVRGSLRPDLPLMVGGSGERRTLRLVARYADRCNLFAPGEDGPDVVAHKLSVLRAHCADVGRDPTEVETTILLPGECDPTGFVERMRPYADLGVAEVHVMHLGTRPLDLVRALAAQVDDLHAL